MKDYHSVISTRGTQPEASITDLEKQNVEAGTEDYPSVIITRGTYRRWTTLT